MENLGCKGTQAHADCNLRPWNGSGSCLRGGFACIACTEPGFESPGHAFQETPSWPASHRPADRHAQGLVRGAGRALQVGDAEAGAQQRGGRSSGRAARRARAGK
jgi:Ni,Fe-hydrogenase I small subunit